MDEEASALKGDTPRSDAVVYRAFARAPLLHGCQLAAHIGVVLFFLLIAAWMGSVTAGAKGLDIAGSRGFGWAAGDKRVFNWHPVLMSAGMVLALGEAILVHATPARWLPKAARKAAHAALLAAVLPTVALGLVAVFRSHNEAVPPVPNMYSAHSWIGAAALVGFALQLAAGASIYGKAPAAAAAAAAADGGGGGGGGGGAGGGGSGGEEDGGGRAYALARKKSLMPLHRE